jgi:sulfatase modifying factor 1
MKPIWCTIAVVTAIACLWLTQANSTEPNETLAPAVDPMRGKEAGEVRDDNALKMKFVWCSPGVVTMENVDALSVRIAGSERNKKQSDDEFDPSDEPVTELQHSTEITLVKAFLTRGYWLGKYEATQSEWTQMMNSEPWRGASFMRAGADFPATCVDWSDATEFCRKLTEQERQAGRLPDDWEYTLPTEAQWERACRARTETRFSFGDDESKLVDHAWFRKNAGAAGELFAHRVGQRTANAWGLCDMHGNVWEWCRDIYSNELPGGRDPEVKRHASPGSFYRVSRGGSWRDDAAGCRSANRGWGAPTNWGSGLGFRVALCAVR